MEFGFEDCVGTLIYRFHVVFYHSLHFITQLNSDTLYFEQTKRVTNLTLTLYSQACHEPSFHISYTTLNWRAERQMLFRSPVHEYACSLNSYHRLKPNLPKR